MKSSNCLIYVIFPVMLLFLAGCKTQSIKSEFNDSIYHLIKNKKLDIGISVRDNTGDEIVSYNQNKKYKLYSVSKYFLGLYILDQVDKGNLNLNQPVIFSKKDLKPDLYSPLRDSNPLGTTLTLKESIKYLIEDSDNNVFDKLIDISGGFQRLNLFVHQIVPNKNKFAINAGYSDSETLFQSNVITPSLTTEILYKMENRQIISDESLNLLKFYMQHSVNNKRIQGLLQTKTKSFHKSGTSGRKDGIITATNDIGIVELQDEQSFSIAVFISNSHEDDATNEYIIAKLADIIYDRLNNM